MHTQRLILILTLGTAIFGASLFLRRLVERQIARHSPPTSVHVVARVVSFAPSITETLFALDCGDWVVGVTTYCTYPPEAGQRPKVGGYFDPNYEAIAALDPDLVIVLPEHESSKRILERQGRRVLTVKQDTLEGLLESIAAIGNACGKPRQAERLRDNLEKRLQNVRERTRGAPRPRVLITAARDVGGGIGEVYIAGKGNFYSQMLHLAGGENAYSGDLPLPSVSREGLARMNPDIIVEMLGDLGQRKLTPKMARDDWRAAPEIEAVRNNRIVLFVDDYDVIPGPRIVKTLEKLARALHPELIGPHAHAQPAKPN